MKLKGGNCPVIVVKIFMVFLQRTGCFQVGILLLVLALKFSQIFTNFKWISVHFPAPFLLSYAAAASGGGGGGCEDDDDNNNNNNDNNDGTLFLLTA
jgi:hypothetical protein